MWSGIATGVGPATGRTAGRNFAARPGSARSQRGRESAVDTAGAGPAHRVHPTSPPPPARVADGGDRSGSSDWVTTCAPGSESAQPGLVPVFRGRVSGALLDISPRAIMLIGPWVRSRQSSPLPALGLHKIRPRSRSRTRSGGLRRAGRRPRAPSGAGGVAGAEPVGALVRRAGSRQLASATVEQARREAWTTVRSAGP